MTFELAPLSRRQADAMLDRTGAGSLLQGFRGGTPRLELMQQRIAFDLWYIDNWSLGLDIYIILRTFFELIRRRNAY